jgi:hypothetical protein
MTIADRYALEAPLEQARFGTTYRALDVRRTGAGRRTHVALWVLPREFTKALPAIRNDLERVRELSHPNIVRVVDFGQHAERLFVASEFTDGEPLRNVLNAIAPERLTLDEADAVVENIGFALRHAHDNGIVHGDVRPENVIVTSDQRVKLANFAQAALARDTPFSPSLLDDTRALAAMAHELYSGERPQGDVRGKAMKRIPSRRRKAIEAAFRGTLRSVPEFLAAAGLSVEHRRRAARAPSRTELPSRPSSWRFALPAAIAGIGVALYASNDVDWQQTIATVTTVVGERGRDILAAPSAGAKSKAPAVAVIDEPTTPEHESTPPDAGTPAPSEASAETPIVEAPPTDHESQTARIKSAAGAAPSVRPRSARASVPDSVRLSASAVTVRESQGVARLDIVRTGTATRPLEVAWWTSDGTAHADDDYAGFGARIETFAPGETQRSLLIPLAGDAVAERPETFFLHVAPGAKANVDAQLTAEIRIVDDDR